MLMSNINGGAASSAVILACAFIYQAAPSAEAAAVNNQTQYTNRFHFPSEINQDVDPEAIFADTDSENLNCLALNIYFESRGESLLGQEFVGWVTLNRVVGQKFPSSICEVVWADRQFSWTQDGKSDIPKNQVAWAAAQQIAQEVIYKYGVEPDPTDGSVFFHANYSSPYWAKYMTKVGQVDNHIFYKES